MKRIAAAVAALALTAGLVSFAPSTAQAKPTRSAACFTVHLGGTPYTFCRHLLPRLP